MKLSTIKFIELIILFTVKGLTLGFSDNNVNSSIAISGNQDDVDSNDWVPIEPTKDSCNCEFNPMTTLTTIDSSDLNIVNRTEFVSNKITVITDSNDGNHDHDNISVVTGTYTTIKDDKDVELIGSTEILTVTVDPTDLDGGESEDDEITTIKTETISPTIEQTSTIINKGGDESVELTTSNDLQSVSTIKQLTITEDPNQELIEPSTIVITKVEIDDEDKIVTTTDLDTQEPGEITTVNSGSTEPSDSDLPVTTVGSTSEGLTTIKENFDGEIEKENDDTTPSVVNGGESSSVSTVDEQTTTESGKVDKELGETDGSFVTEGNQEMTTLGESDKEGNDGVETQSTTISSDGGPDVSPTESVTMEMETEQTSSSNEIIPSELPSESSTITQTTEIETSGSSTSPSSNTISIETSSAFTTEIDSQATTQIQENTELPSESPTSTTLPVDSTSSVLITESPTATESPSESTNSPENESSTSESESESEPEPASTMDSFNTSESSTELQPDPSNSSTMPEIPSESTTIVSEETTTTYSPPDTISPSSAPTDPQSESTLSPSSKPLPETSTEPIQSTQITITDPPVTKENGETTVTSVEEPPQSSTISSSQTEPVVTPGTPPIQTSSSSSSSPTDPEPTLEPEKPSSSSSSSPAPTEPITTPPTRITPNVTPPAPTITQCIQLSSLRNWRYDLLHRLARTQYQIIKLRLNLPPESPLRKSNIFFRSIRYLRRMSWSLNRRPLWLIYNIRIQTLRLIKFEQSFNLFGTNVLVGLWKRRLCCFNRLLIECGTV